MSEYYLSILHSVSNPTLQGKGSQLCNSKLYANTLTYLLGPGEHVSSVALQIAFVF